MKTMKFLMTLIWVSNVMFAAEATSVRLLIIPPNDDGGYSLSRYLVEKMDTDEFVWKKVGYADAMKVEQNGQFVYAKLYFDVIGLTEGRYYKFRVTAENPIGWGEPGPESKEICAEKNLSEIVNVRSGRGKSEGFSSLYEAPSANQALEREIACRKEEWLASLFFEHV